MPETPLVPHSYEALITRFDHRAAGLRRQANIYLGLIISILAAGMLAFAFASEISRFDLRAPPSAQEQLDRAQTTLKTNIAEIQNVQDQLNKLTDTTPIIDKFSKPINQARAAYERVLDTVLTELSCARGIQDPSGSVNEVNLSIAPLSGKDGRHYVYLADRALWFESKDDAELCVGKLRNRWASAVPTRECTGVRHVYSGGLGDFSITHESGDQEHAHLPNNSVLVFFSTSDAENCISMLKVKWPLKPLSDAYQQLFAQRDAAERDFQNSHESEVDVLKARRHQLEQERKALLDFINNTTVQIAREQIGVTQAGTAANSSEIKPSSDETKDVHKIEWQTVVQTNATRFGALGVAFLLVSILVPQYRYNIRMAGFYEARSDALIMREQLGEKMELDKLLKSMTPAIDFGKGPATPIDQITELVKSVRGH